MADLDDTPRVLLVTFPAQGHINPSLQFAKNVAKLGVHVTFLTSLAAIRPITQPSSSSLIFPNINFVSFSDGYENGWSNNDEAPNFMAALRTHGSKAVEEAINNAEKPFRRVIYTPLVPWAGQVAHRLHVPAVTLLWIQPATLFGIYFYHSNNYFGNRGSNADQEVIELPGLPKFERRDLPSFLLDSNPSIYDFALPTFTENFQILDRECIRAADPATVLVNTFDALESDALRAINKYKLTAIGPLIPSAFLDEHDSSDKSFGGDLIKTSVEYMQWLNSQDKSSVIYVAFGSYSELSKPQMEEIAKGLIRSKKPFLWVIRGSKKSVKVDEILSTWCLEELEKQGKIVPWCTQVEVLSHASVGCFVTHCGWNSTLESLVAGVPVVALPQWSDQATNAKLVKDLWGSGVRVAVAKEGDGGGIVEGDEIERCLQIVMSGGERGEAMRRRARGWMELAREAMREDGTSNVNLKSFVGQLVGGE